MDVDKILAGKYPAKAHAIRVTDYIKAKLPDAMGILYLEGRASALLEDSDEPVPWRQRRSFMYLTGLDEEADCYLIHDLSTGHSKLFIPPVDPATVIWSGMPLSPEEALAKSDVDEVLPSSELNAQLVKIGADLKAATGGKSSTVFALADRINPHITFLQFEYKNFEVLAEALDACRVVKDDYEVALIRRANQVSADAHRDLMRRARTAGNESELEGRFIAECYRQNARFQAYPGIFASGRDAATLHYVKNNKPVQGRDLLLVDAGCEWRTYASDITRTYPVSGRFTPESRAVYDVVLRMQTECIGMLRAGVEWERVHERAHRVLIDGLLALGILRGDKDAIFKARTSTAFLPHGLGHYLGMDTHDVGGRPNYADTDMMFRFLRVRTALPAGAVVTVEPGCYFCDFILQPFLKDELHSQYIDEAVLNKYWDVGGVRIEDNLLITEDGCENLTDLVKDPEELEKIVSGSA